MRLPRSRIRTLMIAVAAVGIAVWLAGECSEFVREWDFGVIIATTWILVCLFGHETALVLLPRKRLYRDPTERE